MGRYFCVTCVTRRDNAFYIKGLLGDTNSGNHPWLRHPPRYLRHPGLPRLRKHQLGSAARVTQIFLLSSPNNLYINNGLGWMRGVW
jgi:hypothetical protein